MNPRLSILPAFVLAATAAFSAPPKLYWWFATVDSGDAVRWNSQPRYDKDGNLVVAYRGSIDVKYAEYQEDGTFAKVSADTGAGGDAKVDLAFDEDGRAHVIFQTYNDRMLYHAHQDGNGWKHRKLDDLDHNNLDFYQIALAADKSGGVHAIYNKDRGGGNTAALWYAHLDKDGNPSDTGFILPGNFGKWVSMTTDPDGKPVVAFFRHLGELLEIAWKDGSGWKEDTIGKGQTPATQGFHASIARKDDSTYLVAYKDRENKAIRVATGSPGKEWTTELVDTVAGFTFFSTRNPIVVGKGGTPFVAYARALTVSGVESADTSTLWLAYKEDPEDSVWTHVQLDSVGKVGEYAAMTLSPDSTPVITYYDRSEHRIRIAVSQLTPAGIVPRRPRGRTAALRSGPDYDAAGRRQTVPSDRLRTPSFRLKAGRPAASGN